MPRALKTAPPKTNPAATPGRQMLDELGIRPRIAFPFSPRKAIAALHFLAGLMSSPRRVEHPMLHFKGIMAVLWIADVRHFQDHRRPITGTRWQAYPQGPVPGDVFALLRNDPLWLAELPETHYAVPFELQGDCVTRNLRIPFGYDPKTILGQSDRDALGKAVATAKDLKQTRRVDALRGEAYQLTPLYQDIPWELMLPPKLRSRAVIDELVATARNTVL
jgi:hypothetical protein